MEKDYRTKIPWKKADRFERSREFVLGAEAHEIFPLLCPVREYEWLPGWKCEMAYSKSGAAELDAVFLTKMALGHKALWFVISYEPDRFIEYAIAMGTDGLVRLSVRLEDAGTGRTKVVWAMRFTAISALGKAVLARRFSPKAFGRMLDARERELKAFLKKT